MKAGSHLATGMLAFTLCATASAGAREHGAHVHGAGQLNIAADGKRLEIELIVPGADIVGFEHHPQSPAEKEAVAAAQKELRAGERFFSFPAEASCRLDAAKVDLEAPAQAEDDHDEHDHDDHDHDHPGHAEFHAQYQFDCDRLERLNQIDVRLFQRFTTMRELSAQWILASGQGAKRLTPASARLSF
jgi:hypothetical protein